MTYGHVPNAHARPRNSRQFYRSRAKLISKSATAIQRMYQAAHMAQKLELVFALQQKLDEDEWQGLQTLVTLWIVVLEADLHCVAFQSKSKVCGWRITLDGLVG